MTRVDLLDAAAAPLTARRFYADGDPGPIVAALAQVPELLEVTLPFLGAVLGASAVDARTKEIVILRTSALQGCRYCVDAHTVVALDSPLSRVEVARLRGEDASGWSDPAEAALVAWVDIVGGQTGSVQDEPIVLLRRHYADHEVVELTLLIGATLMLNRFCTALALPTSDAVADRLRREGLQTAVAPSGEVPE